MHDQIPGKYPLTGSILHKDPVLMVLLLTAWTDRDPMLHVCHAGCSLQGNPTVLLKDKVPQYEQEMLFWGCFG